jgi:phosphotransferase system IIA component
MRRSVFSTSAAILGLMLLLTLPVASEAAEIVVQPHTLAIQSAGGTVSVHTDIDYSDGAPWSNVTLNGLSAYLVKADLTGHLVAKFDVEAVKSAVESATTPQVIMQFEALSAQGELFTGADAIILTEKFNRN